MAFDLSDGQHYPPFKQLGLEHNEKKITRIMFIWFTHRYQGVLKKVDELIKDRPVQQVFWLEFIYKILTGEDWQRNTCCTG